MKETPSAASQDNKLNELIAKVVNSSDEQVISMLNELKDSIDISLAPTLIEMLYSSRSETLKRAVVEYLSNIKQTSAVGIMVNSLKDSFPLKNVTLLLTACWQSRLDFSSELDIFIDILIDGNYLTAFEAFTVIENSIHELNTQNLSGYIAKVRKGIVKADRDKQLLLLEMVAVMEKAKREVQ